MGAVSQKIKDIKDLKKSGEIVARFRKTVSAHAIREYLGMKEDPLLKIEINLLSEEICNRIDASNPIYKSGPIVQSFISTSVGAEKNS